LGSGHIGQLDRKTVAHIVRREAGSEIDSEANVKLPAGERKELTGVHDKIETKQIVITCAAPQATLHGAERVDYEEQRWFDSASCQLGTIGEPIAEQVFIAEPRRLSRQFAAASGSEKGGKEILPGAATEPTPGSSSIHTE
jgi:hypothetical protein